MTLTIAPLPNFGLLFPVVCFVCVWPKFIGAALSVIKVYYTAFSLLLFLFLIPGCVPVHGLFLEECVEYSHHHDPLLIHFLCHRSATVPGTRLFLNFL